MGLIEKLTDAIEWGTTPTEKRFPPAGSIPRDFYIPPLPEDEYNSNPQGGTSGASNPAPIEFSSPRVAPPAGQTFSGPSGRGFAGSNSVLSGSPNVGSTRAYRPNMKLPNFSYWRGFSGMGRPERSTAMSSGSPFSDLRLGGVSDTNNPLEDERRRSMDRVFGLS